MDFKAVSKVIRGKIRFSLIEMMRPDNKIVVHFDEDIYDNNWTLYPANVMAIFTLHNGKIKKWEEVANTSYFCQPGYERIVYSH